MGIVTLPSFGTDPATITAPGLDGKVDPLATEFNGNIENANISASAAIVASKLNLATIAQVMAMSSKEFLLAKGADVASATSVTLGTDGNFFDITGTTQIDTIVAKQAGSVVWLQFDGALTVRDKIASSTGNIFNGGDGTNTGFSIATQAGDVLCYICDGTNWILLSREPKRNIIFALTDGANVATNVSQGDIFTLTPTQAFTLDNPTQAINGMYKVWMFRQDGTGGRVITLDSNFRVPSDIGSVVLSTADGDVDYMGCLYDSVDTKWDVVAFIKGYAS